MQVPNNGDAKHRSSHEFDPGDSGRTSQPSSKLKDKLQKLAEWRIESASIKFQEHAPEFRGGHATVLQAFLASTSGSESSMGDLGDASGDPKSGGGITGRKAIAVKKIYIENGKNKERVVRLALREAGLLTGLSHENVIKFEGFVEDMDENRVWLVFPWADNGNLKDFVASANWAIPERVWLIDDVATGVEYLHNQNPPIYHGDLKSVGPDVMYYDMMLRKLKLYPAKANVLVNSGCRAVITDFGSARRLTKKERPVRPEKSKRAAQPALALETEFSEATKTVTLRGSQFTLRWAAPEVLMEDEPGMESGLWSDIWALGWIFYEVITNSVPFHNVRKDSVVIIHVLQGNLPSIDDHASMVLIRALYSLMITCWSIDPSKRPTAEECRKSMTWMPMIRPDRQQATKTSVWQIRSPELLIKMGDMHRLQNDYINASKLFTRALDICTETADKAGKADALLGLARIHKLQSKYRESIEFYSEAVQICTDIGNRRGRADGLYGLADMYRLQEEFSDAITFYSEVVQICTETGYRLRKADALRGLADVHLAQSEYSEAVPLYSEVAEICTEIGDRQGRADALRGLAHVHLAQNEYSKALTLYSEVAQVCSDIGDRQGRANALWGLADIHRLRKRYTQAVQLFSEVLQISTDIGYRQRRAWALMGLADVHRDQDQHEDAIPLYEQAAGILEEIGHSRDAADALNDAAEARRKLRPAESE